MSPSASPHRTWFDGRTAFRVAAGAVALAPVVLLVSVGTALSAGFCTDSDRGGCPSTSTAVVVFVIGSVLVVVPFVAGMTRLVLDVARGRAEAAPDRPARDRRVNRKAVVAVVSTVAAIVSGALTRSTGGWRAALALLVAPLALFAIVHALRAITEVREAGRGARGGAAARWSIVVTAAAMVALVMLPV